jgi:hypothetical protein
VDGTKIKANASKHKAMSYGRMKEKETAIRRQVRELLARADQVDREEDRLHGPDRRGDELPAELATREGRLKKIREAKAALEAEAREKAEQAGQDPRQAKPADKAQRNFTDPDSKIQRTGDGFIQGYNAQVAVDETFQVIVAQHVTPTAPDVNEIAPALESIETVLEAKPEAVLADAGYWSEDNVRMLEQAGIKAFIATNKQKHSDRTPAPRGRPPKSLTVRQRMARTLLTRRGRKIYAQRKVLAEPVIGQIKQARGFRQFLRRGTAKVGEEWALVCTAHNLLKLHTALRLV